MNNLVEPVPLQDDSAEQAPPIARSPLQIVRDAIGELSAQRVPYRSQSTRAKRKRADERTVFQELLDRGPGPEHQPQTGLPGSVHLRSALVR